MRCWSSLAIFTIDENKCARIIQKLCFDFLAVQCQITSFSIFNLGQDFDIILLPIVTFKVTMRCSGGVANVFWGQALPQFAFFIHLSRTPKFPLVLTWSALPTVIKPKSTFVIFVCGVDGVDPKDLNANF